MLSIKKRQEYLKYLGYYKGAIDGKVGRGTKKAYKDLQNDYFLKKIKMDYMEKILIYYFKMLIMLRNIQRTLI